MLRENLFVSGRYVQGCIPERSCTLFLGQRKTLARVNPGSPASPGNLSVRHLFRSYASPTSLLDQRSRQERSPLRGAACFARKRRAKPKGQRTALRRRNEDEHCEDFGRCSQRREFHSWPQSCFFRTLLWMLPGEAFNDCGGLRRTQCEQRR